MKKNKVTRGFAAIILAAFMCMGAVIPALAAGGGGLPIYGDEDTPAKAAITKKLTMPEGTDTPGATFTFEFTKESVDDRDTDADKDTMPNISDITIALAETDTGTTQSSVKTVLKQSGNVLDGVLFPHAGVYVYKVTESQAVTGYTPGVNETYTFSQAEYTITFYVKNGDNGLYVAAIASVISKSDSSNDGSDVGDKVDPAPGDPGTYSQMIFTNTYSATTGGVDPTDPDDQVLVISKTVDGEYGDRTKYFTFDVTATRAAGITTDVIYKAYVLNSANEVVTSAENASSTLEDEYGKYVTFELASDAQTVTKAINLKHGQKIVFTLMHVGTTYEAKESAAEHYTPTVSVIENGGAPESLSAAANTALSTNNRIVGTDENSAAFTNTYRSITPTGVVINNLPFIMILLLAVGAFVAFVYSKSRKRNHR